MDLQSHITGLGHPKGCCSSQGHNCPHQIKEPQAQLLTSEPPPLLGKLPAKFGSHAIGGIRNCNFLSKEKCRQKMGRSHSFITGTWSQVKKKKKKLTHPENLIQYSLYLIIPNPTLRIVLSLFLNIFTSHWRLSKLLDNLLNQDSRKIQDG